MPQQDGEKEIADALAPHVPNFDIKAARAAGVPDSAIVNALAPRVPSFNLAAARAAYAAQAPAAQAPAAQATTPAAPAGYHPGVWDRVKDIALSGNPLQAAALDLAGANKSDYTAAADKGINAALFGQGHRVAAVTQRALNAILPKSAADALGVDQGTYRQLDDKYRASLDEDSANHPTAAALGTVAGSVATPVNELLAPLGAVKGGALAGALAGSGDAKDDLKSQLLGAVGGAAAGGGLGVAAKVPSLFSRLTDEAITPAEQAVADGVSTPDALAARQTAPGLGSVDLLPQLAKDAARSPEGHGIMQAASASRLKANDAALAKSNADALAALGNNDSAEQLLAAAKQDTRDYAAKAYAPINRENPMVPNSGDLARVRSEPDLEAIFQKVKQADHTAGAAPVNRVVRSSASDPNSLGLTSMVPDALTSEQPYSTVKAYQTALQGKASAARRAGDNAEATRLSNSALSIGAHLDDNLGAFNHADITAGYAQKKSVERAISQGIKDWKSAGTADPRNITAAFAKLSPEAQSAYSQAQAANLANTIGNASNVNASAYFNGLAGGKKALAEIAFGGAARFQDMLNHLSTPLPAIPVSTNAPAAAMTKLRAAIPQWRDWIPNQMTGGAGVVGLMTGHPGGALAAGLFLPAERAARRVATAAAHQGEQSASTALAKVLANTNSDAAMTALTRSIAARQAMNASAAKARDALARGLAPRAAAALVNLGFGPDSTPGGVR